MSNILESRKGRTRVETYSTSSYQSIKYSLQRCNENAITCHSRDDLQYSKVDHEMCMNLRSAAKTPKRSNAELFAAKISTSRPRPESAATHT